MRKTIGIFASPRVPQRAHWDPDSIGSGIGGSEEAAIYMSKELASLGYRVLVFTNPLPSSPHSKEDANPRYISRDCCWPTDLDVAIAWRWPEIGSFLKQKRIAKRAYFWPHDALCEPAPSDGFDGVLWLSEWQRRQFSSISPHFFRFRAVFGNGIDPAQFQPVQERENPYSCIYGSNYGRGLMLLLFLWPQIKKEFPKATLDIYYGWQPWTALDPDVQLMMKKNIASLPDVREHGMVGHEELNRAYAKASFWTYPCIAGETFCITALRAQLSGAVPVILEGSALGETVRHGFICKKTVQENLVVDGANYFLILQEALSSAEKISLAKRRRMGKFILKEYTWKIIATRWQQLFESS